VFQANSLRASVGAAIAEAEAEMSVYSFNAVFNYRQMAVMVQNLTETCISSSTSRVVPYVPRVAMSLRAIAFANGLAADRQNDISELNPFLASINRVEAGTVVLVPVA
jgi:hypothetical protein